MKKGIRNFIIFMLILIVTPFSVPLIQADELEPFFDITFLYPTCGGPPCYEWVPNFAEDLKQIGINVTLYPHLYWVMELRTIGYSGPFPIPPFNEGGFDILIWYFDNDFMWPASDRFSTNSWTPTGSNFYQYSNTEFDLYASLYENSHTLEERLPYLQEMQRILYEDKPSLGVYYPNNLYLIKDSISGYDLTLWHEDSLSLATWKIENKTNLNIGQYSSQIYRPHPFDVFYISESSWVKQMYTGLLTRENYTHLWVPSLATSYDTADRLNWIFHLDQKAKWSNGENITADDVVFSYKSVLNSTASNLGAYAEHHKLAKYMDNNSVSKIDNHTVQFTLTKLYSNAEELFDLPIIPKDIWLPVSKGGTGPEYQDWFSQALIWVETDPEMYIVSGPFKVHYWNETENLVHMKKNYYFENSTNGFDPYLNDIIINNSLTHTSAYEAFNNNIIDFYAEKSFVTWNPEEYEFIGGKLHEVQASDIIELAFNNMHPVFGTGELCPIPGPESARHVRKAFDYMLKREYLIETDWRIQGIADPAAIPFPQVGLGYNSSFTPVNHSIDLAKYHMREAGYDIPVNVGTSMKFGIPFLNSLAIIGLLGASYLLYLRRKRT